MGSYHASEDGHQRQRKDKDSEPELSDGYVELAHIYSDRFGALRSLFRSWGERLVFEAFSKWQRSTISLNERRSTVGCPA